MLLFVFMSIFLGLLPRFLGAVFSQKSSLPVFVVSPPLMLVFLGNYWAAPTSLPAQKVSSHLP